jgi:type II restriction-modification system methylation subunit
MMGNKHVLINGDSRNMAKIADQSVHLIVTSPPYWQLKDYGTTNQIGFHDSYEAYINDLNLVWMECARILHNGCRLCINIGDQFARSVYYGRYKVIPIRTEIIRFCEHIGLDYMGSVIWQKQTTMHTTGGGAVMGSFPYPRNGILKIDYEFILIFKKQGNAPKPTTEQKEASILTKEEWNEYFKSHWTFPGAKQDGHIAVFPVELPLRLIKMFSFVGETVFDPFMGSGTTALAAQISGRNSMGYEINSEFKTFYQTKLNVGHSLFSKDNNYAFEQDNTPYCRKERIEKLPYVFHDALKMNNKVDIKSLQFGSKIDKNVRKNDTYYTIKNVLSPTELILNTGLKIRLLGIKPIKEKQILAIDFLSQKTKGHKVYLRFDSEKYDADDTLMCYLYLENRTFLNMHLIKSQLAVTDVLRDFKYKEKFLSYQTT